MQPSAQFRKAKMAKTKKIDPIFLSSSQVGHLINGSVKNLIHLNVHADDTGYKFLLVLDCIVPEACIPVDQEPHSEEECDEIIGAHTILELADYIEVILPVKHIDGKYYRGFSTIYIDESNIAAFVDSLGDLEYYWAEIDQGISDEEEAKTKTAGKNVVEGNDTVN